MMQVTITIEGHTNIYCLWMWSSKKDTIPEYCVGEYVTWIKNQYTTNRFKRRFSFFKKYSLKCQYQKTRKDWLKMSQTNRDPRDELWQLNTAFDPRRDLILEGGEEQGRDCHSGHWVSWQNGTRSSRLAKSATSILNSENFIIIIAYENISF